MSAAPLPMKATAGSLPVGDGWRYEVKWDGMRAIAVVHGNGAHGDGEHGDGEHGDGEHGDGAHGNGAHGVRLYSSTGRDVTVAFPELVTGPAPLAVPGIVDGEIVVLDGSGRSDFGALQHRMHRTDPRAAAEGAATHPVHFVVFDLLALDGHDTTGLPFDDRRRILESAVVSGRWRCTPVDDDGPGLLAAAADLGLEGVVAKRGTSRYRPGTRTTEWIKTKLRRRQEFVVGGWAPERGTGVGPGALLVGFHDPDGGALTFAGRVGSGIGAAARGDLAPLLAEAASDRCPFEPAPEAEGADVHWVRPELVVEVEFAEWTPSRRLRHPAYRGRRTDVDPATVTADP